MPKSHHDISINETVSRGEARQYDAHLGGDWKIGETREAYRLSDPDDPTSYIHAANRAKMPNGNGSTPPSASYLPKMSYFPPQVGREGKPFIRPLSVSHGTKPQAQGSYMNTISTGRPPGFYGKKAETDDE